MHTTQQRRIHLTAQMFMQNGTKRDHNTAIEQCTVSICVQVQLRVNVCHCLTGEHYKHWNSSKSLFRFNIPYFATEKMQSSHCLKQ